MGVGGAEGPGPGRNVAGELGAVPSGVGGREIGVVIHESWL